MTIITSQNSLFATSCLEPPNHNGSGQRVQPYGVWGQAGNIWSVIQITTTLSECPYFTHEETESERGQFAKSHSW